MLHFISKETRFESGKFKIIKKYFYTSTYLHALQSLFTVVETSMGIKFSNDPTCMEYKKSLYDYGDELSYRLLHPWLRDSIYWMTAAGRKTRRPSASCTTSPTGSFEKDRLPSRIEQVPTLNGRGWRCSICY